MVGVTPELARRFQNAVPRVKQWIDELLAAHARSTIVVSDLGFVRISQCYPKEFLELAKVMHVDEVPRPPLEKFELPELSRVLRINEAITLNNTSFIIEAMRTSESLHFHELVHVVQWQRLGMDRFLLAYAAGLITYGYRQNPLESMAYKFQAEFDSGKTWSNIVGPIQKLTDGIWSQVAGALPA
jgi:hypothetical protein